MLVKRFILERSPTFDPHGLLRRSSRSTCRGGFVSLVSLKAAIPVSHLTALQVFFALLKDASAQFGGRHKGRVSGQHIAAELSWSVHSHIGDIQHPKYMFLSKMQKVFFFSLQRKSVLPLNMQNELAELAGFFFSGWGAGFMSVRSNAFKLGSVLPFPVYGCGFIRIQGER